MAAAGPRWVRGSTTGSEIISVAPNGDVYAGGSFNELQPHREVERHGVGLVLGTGVNSVVEEIQFADNGAGGFDVIVAGQFTTAGGAPANRIAKWNGSAWSAFGSGVDGIVDVLWVDPRAGGYDIYVGGWFLERGRPAREMHRQMDGTEWSEVGGGVNAATNPSVNALVKHAGVLYVGGNFSTAGGDSAYAVAAWDGSTWSPLGRGFALNSGPDAIVVSDTSVYIGGLFSTVGCVNSANFARFSLASATTGVDDAPPAPAVLSLSPPAPNPFPWRHDDRVPPAGCAPRVAARARRRGTRGRDPRARRHVRWPPRTPFRRRCAVARGLLRHLAIGRTARIEKVAGRAIRN